MGNVPSRYNSKITTLRKSIRIDSGDSVIVALPPFTESFIAVRGSAYYCCLARFEGVLRPLVLLPRWSLVISRLVHSDDDGAECALSLLACSEPII